jgi:MarR-like DNA-binding transcriptional regulator SgrR of sgrS sRNA
MAAPAATRPGYGGTLRVGLAGPLPDIDPSTTLADAALEYRRNQITPLFAETLVRINDRGVPEALLATSWTQQQDGRRWRFELRPGVSFHDGTPLTAALAAEALSRPLAPAHVTASQTAVIVDFPYPRADALFELSRSHYSIVRRSADGKLTGTGPFTVLLVERGTRVVLNAFEGHWAGRPFLNSIEFVSSGANVDVSEIGTGTPHRPIQDRLRMWASSPSELLALVCDDVPPPVRQALHFAIDRAAIVNVLVQRRGEPAASLLPQWLTGYSFVFAAKHDATAGAALLRDVRLQPLTLAYQGSDPLARNVAERIAVNARDAGILIRPVAAGSIVGTANLNLVRQPFTAGPPLRVLAALARALRMQQTIPEDEPLSPQALYELERSLLQERNVIPLAHLSRTFALSPRVRNFTGLRSGDLRLENVWLAPQP